MTRAPKGPDPDQDAITYLPVDRTGVRDPIYAPTDPRDARATGGMRIGDSFIFVLDEAMPRLQPEIIGRACDNLVRGRETYASLLYLQRARNEDVVTLLGASQSAEVKVRWERLWVLSPFLARLARTSDGRRALMAAFNDDLSGIHLLSKFVEQNNHAVRRLFTRLHDAMLPFLLARLVQHQKDPRRAMLLVSIIATVEVKEDLLRAALPAELKATERDELLGLLYVRLTRGHDNRLSSTVMRDKLQSWRR